MKTRKVWQLSIIAGTVAFNFSLNNAPSISQRKESTNYQLSSEVGKVIEDKSSHPFRINVPEADLVDLRQRVVSTPWLDIRFLYVRSKHASALPLIINHRWPCSIVEQIKLTG